MFMKDSLYGKVIDCAIKIVIVVSILFGAYMVMDNTVSSNQLVAYAEEEDEGTYYKTTKQSFAEQYKVEYLDTTVEESAGTIDLNLVDESKNPWKLPWYKGYTMSGNYVDFDMEKELSKESGGATAYANDVTKPITNMDIDADAVNMDAYAALWADKTKEGDKTAQVPGFKPEYHKSIKVENSWGQVGNIAIADSRVIVAVGPRVRALITGEKFNPNANSPDYESMGKVRGAYIDVIFEDGSVLACITGEAKSMHDHWEYNYLIHNSVSGGCLEILVNNRGLSGTEISGYQTIFGKMKIKGFRVYTDARFIKGGTNEVTYYFSESLGSNATPSTTQVVSTN